MSTNILLEAGTNELEVVEFYLDETVLPGEATLEGLTEQVVGAEEAGNYRG